MMEVVHDARAPDAATALSLGPPEHIGRKGDRKGVPDTFPPTIDDSKLASRSTESTHVAAAINGLSGVGSGFQAPPRTSTGLAALSQHDVVVSFNEADGVLLADLAIRGRDGTAPVDRSNQELDLDAGHLTPQPNLSSDSLSSPTTAAIYGQGVPDIPAFLSVPEPTVITDLGEGLSRLHHQRTNSYPTSSDSAPGGLGTQLNRAICRLGLYGDGFLPRGQLKRILNKEDVESELRKHESSVRRRLRMLSSSQEDLEAEASRICGTGELSWPAYNRRESATALPRHLDSRPRFQKIMAILLLIERPSRIRSFIKEEVCDADLPLVRVSTGSKAFKRWELRRRKNRDTRLRCFDKWRQVTMERFEKRQWAVLAPFFARDPEKPEKVPHYYLPDQVIRPFLASESMAQGGFGEVCRVQIHPDHHNFLEHNLPGAKRDLFAMKKLLSAEEDDFKREVEILKRVNKNPHDHLITLLATYQYRGSYYLIFPWAEGDLVMFWKTQTPRCDKNTARWLAEQCQGLASGLAEIHGYKTTPDDSITPLGKKEKRTTMRFCRHGDIKPGNILWFPSPEDQDNTNGTLKISDFGTAEFTAQKHGPDKVRPPGTPMYEPPEAHPRVTNLAIGPSYDVWGLGCIYLEFITWFLGGWQYVEQFLDRRLEHDNIFYDFAIPTFFAVVPDETTGGIRPMIKQSVLEFIDILHSHPACTQFLHDFLILIREGMLLVEGEGGRIRLSASEVARRLADMQQRGRRHGGYFNVPVSPGDQVGRPQQLGTHE